MSHQQCVEGLLPAGSRRQQLLDDVLLTELEPERLEIAENIDVDGVERQLFHLQTVEGGRDGIDRRLLAVVGEPRMAHDVGHLDALFWIHLEHPPDKVLGCRFEPFRHHELSGTHLAEQLLDVGVIERKAATKKRKEDDTATPDVTGSTLVPLAADDLGTGVVGRTTAGLEHLFGRLKRSHTKVGNLDDLLGLVKKQILGLEITMADVEAVTVVHAEDDLSEVAAGVSRSELALGDKVVEELTASDIFHDEEAVAIRIPSVNGSRCQNVAQDNKRLRVGFWGELTDLLMSRTHPRDRASWDARSAS